VSSVILSTPSQQIQKLIVNIPIPEEEDEGKGDTQGSGNLAVYGKLDDALCKPAFQQLEFTLGLSRSPNAVETWQQRLSSLLPKFVALGRTHVRSSRVQPLRRWSKELDGF